MRRAAIASLGFLALACAPGCKTTYELSYAYVLDGAEEASPLSFEDGGLHFQFWPTPAGVMFEIANKTDDDATLEWDDCYFVQPDGNSYKALNTDVLDEADEVVLKSRYSSIVPSRASLKRFTTATVNAQTATSMRISEVAQFYTTTHLQWDAANGWWWQSKGETTTFSSVTDIQSYDSWHVSKYYPTEIVITKEREEQELKAFAGLLKEEPAYSLGLAVHHDGVAKTHRFTFTIDKVFAVGEIEQRDSEGRRLQVEAVIYVLDPADGWEWKRVDHPPVASGRANSRQ